MLAVNDMKLLFPRQESHTVFVSLLSCDITYVLRGY